MKIFIAIPALDELDYLPVLMEDLMAQAYNDFAIFVCVNNPDIWWNDSEKRGQCENNSETLEYLKNIDNMNITLIDKSSKGHGWKGKAKGVGFARKELFEAINKAADEDDLIISLDADTGIEPSYIASVRKQFIKNKQALLLANSYYHKLTGNESNDRAILRYELYMRYYLINLLKINSPYAFSALGSAISFRMKGYRKINGITPKEAGEDFYFVNRMKKAGDILIFNDQAVYPSSRESDRVPFGTGPAVIKGQKGDWDSYPFYDIETFRRIGETYELFPKLFLQDCETPIDDFIGNSLGENIWEPLRKNFKTEKLFIRACHEKIDGLRILQILRFYQKDESLANFIKFGREELFIELQNDFTFESSSVEKLDEIRNIYFMREMETRERINSPQISARKKII